MLVSSVGDGCVAVSRRLPVGPNLVHRDRTPRGQELRQRTATIRRKLCLWSPIAPAPGILSVRDERHRVENTSIGGESVLDLSYDLPF